MGCVSAELRACVDGVTTALHARQKVAIQRQGLGESRRRDEVASLRTRQTWGGKEYKGVDGRVDGRRFSVWRRDDGGEER